MSIGAVKAVEIGDGTEVSKSRGSENNDFYLENADGIPYKSTNHSGGILGGISDGSRSASAPPSSRLRRLDSRRVC